MKHVKIKNLLTASILALFLTQITNTVYKPTPTPTQHQPNPTQPNTKACSKPDNNTNRKACRKAHDTSSQTISKIFIKNTTSSNN